MMYQQPNQLVGAIHIRVALNFIWLLRKRQPFLLHPHLPMLRAYFAAGVIDG